MMGSPNDDMISAAFYIQNIYNGHSALCYGETRKPSGFVFSIRIP
jgi:hypothetical protein